MPRPRTIAAELRRRKDCRYGLAGVQVRLLDDGKLYRVTGSGWDECGHVVVDLVPETEWEDYLTRDRIQGPVTAAELLAYTPPAYLVENVAAARCVLVSEWPEVCGCWK